MKKLSYLQNYWIFEISAYLTSIGVPIVTALCMFPPEILEETKMSIGLSVIIAAIIAVTVFSDRLGESIKNTKGGNVWLVVTAFALLGRYISDQLTVIGIVGMIANYGSIPLFNLADKNKQLNEQLKEAQQKAEIDKKVGSV